MLDSLIFSFLFILCGVNSYDLIKRGDFQNYQGLAWTYGYINARQTTIYFKFSLKQSDFSQWYDQAQGKVQILQHRTTSYITSTYTVDLSSTIPMTLCQDIKMEIGSKYILSYDLFTSYCAQNMVGNAYLSGVLLTSLYIASNMEFGRKVFSFYSDKSTTALCFNETHQPSPPFAFIAGAGGLIDNISLILVQKQYIMFKFRLEQLSQRVFLLGNQTYDQILATAIENQYDLCIDGNPITYSVESSETGLLWIQITESYSFRLKSLKFRQKSGYIHPLYSTQREVTISTSISSRKYFFYLQQNQIEFINKTKQVIFLINQFNFKINIYSQMLLFAYLINMIIDMEILSLFYIFTQIQVIPGFTWVIYHQVLRIIFSAESVYEYFFHFFNISIKKIDLFIQASLPQRIEEQKNQQPWFGTYSLSSKVIQGNLSSLFLLILSFIKFGVRKMILRFLGIFFPSILKKKTCFFTHALTEYFFLMPIIVISISANLIDSVKNTNQKYYKIFCISFFCIHLFLIFYFLFLPSYNRNKKINSKKNSQQNESNEIIQEQIIGKKSIEKDSIKQKEVKGFKKKKILVKYESKKEIKNDSKNQSKKEIKNQSKNQSKTEIKNKQVLEEKDFKKGIENNFESVKRSKTKIIYSQYAFFIPMLFFIPFMSFLLNPKLFLAINTFTILFRICAFLKYNQRKDKLELVQRFCQFITGFVFIIHHTIFVIFFYHEDKNLSVSQIKFIIYLGIGAILTVLTIVLLQIIIFIFQIVQLIQSALKILISRIKKIDNKQEQPENSQELSNQTKLTIQVQKIDNKMKIKKKVQKPKIIHVKMDDKQKTTQKQHIKNKIKKEKKNLMKFYRQKHEQ